MTIQIVYHIYVCGHVDVDTVDSETDLEQPYVFVEGACSRALCSNTDPSCFVEQMDVPSAYEVVALEAAANELHRLLFADIPRILQKRDALLLLKDEIERFASEEVTALLCAEDSERQPAIDAHFEISATAKLLQMAVRFAKKRPHRRFYEFCWKLATCKAGTMAARLEELATTVHRLERWESFSDLPTGAIVGRFPPLWGLYEPNFGVEDIRLLRAAGPIGLWVLSQSFTFPMLQYADWLIHSVRQHEPAVAKGLVGPTSEYGEGLNGTATQCRQKKASGTEVSMSDPNDGHQQPTPTSKKPPIRSLSIEIEQQIL